jgi:hypothetical protein
MNCATENEVLMCFLILIFYLAFNHWVVLTAIDANTSASPPPAPESNNG